MGFTENCHRTLWHTLQRHKTNLLQDLKTAGYDVLWGGKNDLLSPDSCADSTANFRLDRRSTRAIRPSRGGRNTI